MGNVPARLTGKYKSYDISDHHVDVPSLTLKRHISIYKNDADNVDTSMYGQQSQQHQQQQHQLTLNQRQPPHDHLPPYQHSFVQKMSSVPVSSTTTHEDDEDNEYDYDNYMERSVDYSNTGHGHNNNNNNNYVENDAMHDGAYGRQTIPNVNNYSAPGDTGSDEDDDDDLFEAARHNNDRGDEDTDDDNKSNVLQVINDDSNLDDDGDDEGDDYDPALNDLHADGVSRLTESVDLTPHGNPDCFVACSR